MMFDAESVYKILKGKKCVTRRLFRADGRRPAVPGSIHKLKIDRTKKTYGYILINSCTETLVKDIDEKEAKREGFNSVKEYIEYFMDVNDIDILSDYDKLWRVRFTFIGKELNEIGNHGIMI